MTTSSQPAAAPASSWSRIGITRVRGLSRPTTCRSISPLKILNPDAPAPACHMVLSSYGGGLVQGDRIYLDVTCREDTTLYLGSQANTRIYKNTEGLGAAQHLQGKLHDGALLVVNPDPLVPHTASDFHQVSNWQLSPTSDLVLIDWIHSGRSDSGERFAYAGYTSEVAIKVNDRTVLLDRFSSSPCEESPQLPSRFGPYQTLLNMYIAGPRVAPLLASIGEAFKNREKQQVHDLASPQAEASEPPPTLMAVNQVSESLLLIRALGKKRSDLDPLLSSCFTRLASPDFLGFDPYLRKY